MPLREGDYQVGIISYDSNTMKYQLLVLIHLLKASSRLVIPECRYECSPQDRLLLFMFGSHARTTNAYSPNPNPQFSLCISTDTTTSTIASFPTMRLCMFHYVKTKFINFLPLERQRTKLWVWLSL